MQVRRRRARVTSVADVTEHVPGLDVRRTFESKAIEMRVVEGLAEYPAAQPYHVAAEAVGARLRGAIDDRECGRAARRENVEALMPPAAGIALRAELALNRGGRQAANWKRQLGERALQDAEASTAEKLGLNAQHVIAVAWHRERQRRAFRE